MLRDDYIKTPSRGALASLVLTVWLTIVPGAVAVAADDNGKFAIKGGGLQTCAKFTEAFSTRSSNLALYGGWIEGFVTAQNQNATNTYDIVPWQTTSTLLDLTRAACKQTKPQTRFIDAFAGVFQLLFRTRLTAESEVVGISNGEASTVAYLEVLKRVQDALRAEGYDIPNTTGDFDATTVRQLMDYQTKNGLVATGLPDQPTLFKLLLQR